MTIKISNLPDVTHSELREFLAEQDFRVEKIKPMKDRDIDKSESTEYVRLKEGDDAEFKAIEILNGKMWKGKELSVSLDTTYHDDGDDQNDR